MTDIINQARSFDDWKEPFEITVKINDELGFASIGYDTLAASSLSYAAGVIELAQAYVRFVHQHEEHGPYDRDTLRELHSYISSNKLDPWNKNDQEGLRFAFPHFIQRRQGGRFAVASGPELRVEFRQIYRENPTFLKSLWIAGKISSVIIVTTFCGIQLIKQNDSPQCRAQYLSYLESRSAAIEKQARFEGKLTDKHREALRDAQRMTEAGIAACGSNFEKFKIVQKGKGFEIILDVGPENKKN